MRRTGIGQDGDRHRAILARRGWRPSPPVGNTARQMGSKWYYEDTNSIGNGGGYGAPSIASVPTLNAETPAFADEDDARERRVVERKLVGITSK